MWAPQGLHPALTPPPLQVVSVMIADPLYKWAMSPIKAKQRQQERPLQGGGGGADGEAEELLADTSALPAAAGGGNNAAAVAADAIGNADAERAVLRVRQKLEGVEVRAEHCEWRSSLVGKLRATLTSPRGRQDRHSPPDCLPLFRSVSGLPPIYPPSYSRWARADRAVWRARWRSCCQMRKTRACFAGCITAGQPGCRAGWDKGSLGLRRWGGQ